jgi:hypothetical protein
MEEIMMKNLEKHARMLAVFQNKSLSARNTAKMTEFVNR